MPSDEIREYYDFITTVTHEAGKIVFDGFFDSKEVEMKGNVRYDLVTNSDKKAEEFITSKIQNRYPDHLIIGEETCTSDTELTDLPTWIIDPIDGTINFIREIPLIGISVALSINKEVVIGIVYSPIINQFFAAVKGGGAYCNGKEINSTNNEDLHKAIVGNELSLASIPFLRSRTLERINKLTEYGVLGFRCFGSAALSICYLAKGSLDVYFTDGLKCWDVAAAVLILEEAGGCASSPDGEKFDMFSQVLLTAGNEALLQKMVEILKECDENS